jgi:hypothetical protein
MIFGINGMYTLLSTASELAQLSRKLSIIAVDDVDLISEMLCLKNT